jgi:hypothetical protein
MTRTTAQTLHDIHTQRSLQAVAQDQASSRVLSQATRDYFATVARGVPFDDRTDDVVSTRESAFFEAAASMSTRHGQSYSRRLALGDLQRLRMHLMSHLTIPTTRYYATGLPATVVVNADGTVEVCVDLTEAAAAVADTAQPGAIDDSAIVAAAVANHHAAVKEA